MGFLKFHEGKDQEALAYFERAMQADSTRYLSTYYRAMLSDRSNAQQLRAALNRVIELNPDFAPAYIQLAVSYIEEGKLESAVPFAIKAQQLWPSKAGYHLFIGSILHRLGRDNETAAIARYVAERWQGISHEQAVDLWQKLPADTRRGADFKKTILRTDTREVSGKIESIECRNKNQTMIIVLDGSRMSLRMTSAQISFGLADTVWYGPDHFDTCLHLKGLRAAIQYRPTSPGSPSGDLTQIEIFDDYGL
jgi:tetratricopeptide (TPR) repeat protein